MKRVAFSAFLSLSLIFASCNSGKTEKNEVSEDIENLEATENLEEGEEIKYELAFNYFIKNDVKDKVPVKITSQEEFNKYFGMAATMGEGGRPTEIDFSKNYVIVADYGTVKNKSVSVQPTALNREGNKLVLDYYVVDEGENTHTSRPFAIAIVSGEVEGEVVLRPEEVPVSYFGDNSRNSLDWGGTYKGIIPCASCPGIEVILKINYDNDYTMSWEYLERDVEKVKSSGKFKWDATGSKITLTSGANEEQFFIGEGRAWMLNRDGERVTGELADHYILEKVE